MAINNFVPESVAVEMENLWVRAYSPGVNSDEVEDTVMMMVQKLAHLLMSPNGQFKAAHAEVQSMFRYQCEKAAEQAHEEQNIISDRENGYQHCPEMKNKHPRHYWHSDGKSWECSGLRVAK